MSHTHSTAPPDLGDALRELAAQAEAHPAPSLDARDALAWIVGRLQSLAAKQPEPVFCASCAQRLASTPRGLLN